MVYDAAHRGPPQVMLPQRHTLKLPCIRITLIKRDICLSDWTKERQSELVKAESNPRLGTPPSLQSQVKGTGRYGKARKRTTELNPALITDDVK